MADILDGRYHLVSALSIDNVSKPGTQDRWRLYNPNSGEHFYTASYAEYVAVMKAGWRGEGIAFQSTADASSPVYRLYNPNAGDHHYTLSAGERDHLVSVGWRYEGVAFKVDAKGNVPMHRLYNPNAKAGAHFFTASTAERDHLVRLGWGSEGVGWYGASVFALDTAADVMANGTNVQLGQYCRARSQAWELTTRADGTRQLTNRLGGKALDSAGQAAGRSARVWADVDDANQTWVVTDSGSTATVDGVTCALCYVRLKNGLALTASSAAYLADVRVQAYGAGSRAQLWALMPVPAFENGQVYELVNMRDSSRQLTVTGTPRNGARARTAAHSGGNEQKFMALQYQDGVALFNLAQGRSLDLVGGPASYAKDGTGVDAWDSNGGRGQRWKVTEAGEARALGKVCTVYALGAGNVDTCRMEAHGVARGSDEVSIRKVADLQEQTWAFVPTHATSANIPAPYEVGVALSTSDRTSRTLVLSGDTGFVPDDLDEGEEDTYDKVHATWRMPTSNVLLRGNAHCEVRIRRRTIRTGTTAWGAWGEWTAWAPRRLHVSGDRAWDADGIILSSDGIRCVELEVSVRCVTALDSGTITVRGPAVTSRVRYCKRPRVTFSAAGWSVDGLRLQYESDWTAGDTYITVRSVTTRWGTVATTRTPNARLRGDESSTVLVPSSKVAWPSDGSEATVAYSVGTEEEPDMPGTLTATVTVRYDAGSGTDVTPRLSKGTVPGTILATVPHLGTDRLWLGDQGRNAEVQGTTGGGSTTYVLAPPLGRGFDLWASCVSADGDAWGTARLHVTEGQARALGVVPMHLWTWRGDGVAVRLASGSPIATERKVDATYEAREVDSRDHQAVTFAPTRKSTWSASGVYVRAVDGTDGMAAMERLSKARHVRYRSPSGESCDVAVVGYTITRHRRYDEVSVSMVEETV